MHLYIYTNICNNMNSQYDIDFLEDVTEKLKAVAHPIRFLMIDILFNEKQLSVTEIYEKLEIEQAVASHHLRILKNQNLVKVTRDGKNAFYSLAHPNFHQIITAMTKN